MHYTIIGLCPGHVRDLGSFGFCIRLHRDFRRLVALANFTDEDVKAAIDSMHRFWLDGAGYDARYDPDCDNHPFLQWPTVPQVRAVDAYNARPVYGRHCLRVTWGEWGPEHISVPGNACGLDIDRHALGAPEGGVVLTPHNVDSHRQQHLLLIIFTWFAETLLVLTDDGTKPRAV